MSASGPVEIETARRLVAQAVTPLRHETVGLDAAEGLILAEDVSSDEQVPAFDGSAMDGFALRSGDLLPGSGVAGPLRVIGESRAGAPASVALGAGEAIAISTGAMVPAGADAIVPVEDTRTLDGRVEVLQPVSAGANLRRAGEDIAAGDLVLRRGSRLGAAELGVLASLGRVQVSCAPRPIVSVLVSGDELLAPGEPLRPGAIRDSNSITISALAREAGATVRDAGRVGDDAGATVRAIAAAAENADVAVICGGVSVGAHDHVRPGLQALGATTGFWGVKLKPGRPLWFGTLDGTLVFGLPGNPVSAMVCFLLFVGPALRALSGARRPEDRLSAVMDRDYEKPEGRAHAVRCRLIARDDGWHAEPTGAQGSHILTSMLGADALAIVPAPVSHLHAGERVEIEPLRPWLGAHA